MKLFSNTLPWYKANFHMHTTRSDGRKSPEEAAALYRGKGYSILAITDHRTVSPARRSKDFLQLSGIELNTVHYCAQPGQEEVWHIVGIGISEDLTKDSYSENPSPQELIDCIRTHGGEAILAHPAWSLNRPDRIRSLTGLCAAEIYNTVSSFPWNAHRPDSSLILDQVSDLGTIINTVASDDAHFYQGDECRSFTMIQPETFSEEGVLNALRQGKFYASQGPQILQAEVTENEIRIVCTECAGAIFYSNLPWVADRAKNTPEGAKEFRYTIQPGDTYVRAEIFDRNGKRAWLNPIPVNRGKGESEC